MLLLLLQALNSWLQLRVVSAHWELTREIERYCDATENAILEARSVGNDALADRLLQRFARASSIVVPATGSVAPSAGANIPSAKL